MIRRILPSALLAAGLLLHATPAAADPISAIVAIAQVVAVSGTTAMIAGVALTTIATYAALGAALVGGVLARKKAKEAARAARNATREAMQERTIVMQSSEPVPRVIYGRCAVGGDVIDRFSSPKTYLADGGVMKTRPDALQHIVIAVAHHQCQALYRIHLGGQWYTVPVGGGWLGDPSLEQKRAATVTRSTVFPVSGSAIIALPDPAATLSVVSITRDSGGSLGTETAPTGWTVSGATISGVPAGTWDVTCQITANRSTVRVEFMTGAVTQTVNSYLTGINAARWPASKRLQGIAYVVLTLDLDDAQFQGGLPSDLSFDISGRLVLDPRTDVTAWSDNTALCIYDWLRSEWGYSLAVADIDTASVIAAANSCDAIVGRPLTTDSVATGRFSVCNGSFRVSDDRASILSELTENMGGFASPGAVWTVSAGAWTSSVMSLSDADAMAPIQIVRQSAPHDEAFNGARASIVRAGKREPSDVDPYQAMSYVTADGGAEWQTFSFPFCADPGQARHLMRVFVEQARAGMIIQYTGGMRLWPLQPGDRVTITADDYIAVWGAPGKTFRVLDRQWAPGQPVSLTLQEDVASTYDSADATDPDPAPNTSLPSPRLVDVPSGLVASSGTATLLQMQDGTIVPRVRMTWNAPVTLYMQSAGASTELRWRSVTDTAWQTERLPRDAASAMIGGVQDLDMLVIELRHINTVGVESQWVTIAHRVIGKSAPPSAVVGLAASAVGGDVLVTWTVCPDLDYASTELRVGPVFATAGRIGQAGGSGADRFLWINPAVGTHTIWAQHQDESGNDGPVSSTTVVATAAAGSATGGNQLFNSDFSLGWRGWSSINGVVVGKRSMNLAGWTIAALSPISGNTGSISQGPPVGNLDSYCEETSDPIPVTPLAWYCASAYTGAHRCRTAVFAYFYDASGASVGHTYGPPATCENNSEMSGGSALAGYKRVFGVGQAPATARTARLVLRKYDTVAGQANSYMFACRAMFEPASSAASTPGAWSPGPIGYTGDLDATKGAPVGTLVGSTLAQTVESNAAEALQGVNDINADGKWSPIEKAALVVDWNRLNGSVAPLVAQANVYGIVTERNTFTSAVNALSVYLTGLAPPWNDTTTTTTILRATADQLWGNAYNALTALQTRIDDEAGKRATWTTVTGVGKPQDNATVGATFGTNIAGQITPANVTTFMASNTISESAAVTTSGTLGIGFNSPIASCNGGGLVLVLVVGAVTVAGEPSSSNAPTVGKLVLVINGAEVGYSTAVTGVVGSNQVVMGSAVVAWQGALGAPVSAYIKAMRPSGNQAVEITNGTTLSIISLKR
jgi:hypothetical protein